MTMDMDSDEDSNTNGTSSPARRDKLLDNEMRSYRNRGFHDGYDEGKKAVIQEAFDTGYKKAFEQNFILSTLKGVASALKSSYNLNQSHRHQQHQDEPPSTPPTSSSSASDLNSSTSSPVSRTSSTSTTSSSTMRGGSPHHLRMLESMKFDGTSDIESIKNDLITICRENRLEILAHYVSQIR